MKFKIQNNLICKRKIKINENKFFQKYNYIYKDLK